MRVLLIAYDFPPIPSPQSLRWAYLVRELDRQGHQVSVLAADLPGYGAGGLPVLPESVQVHRVRPGILTSGFRFLGMRVDRGVPYWSAETPVSAVATGSTGPVPERLNWKGRLFFGMKSLLPGMSGSSVRHAVLRVVRQWASAWIFPDYRAEWTFWARRELKRMLESQAPDLVVTSHEPAFTLSLGRDAKRQGFPWVADLGDPVLAPYTPARWRKRAFELERMVCTHADLVMATSERTILVLEERHGVRQARFHLLTQGFDAERPAKVARDVGITFEGNLLELLYTGSFYAFRRIDALLDAVIATSGVRLTVATITPPKMLEEAGRLYPEKVRIVGFLPHDRALDLQRQCDVLVNIANDDPMQIPGKVYEYLGSGTRMLHVGDAADGATDLISRLGAGICERNDAASLAARLRDLHEEKMRSADRIEPRGLPEGSAEYSWQALAGAFRRRVETVIRR